MPFMATEQNSTLRIIRIATFAAILVLLGTIGTLFVLKYSKGDIDTGSNGQPFALTSMDGAAFDGSSLAGRPYAMFFGFTHCPDVCPTTMQEVADALAAVGAPAKDFQVLFVTLDPARDTADLLRTYLGAFDPRILGLRGDQKAIDALVARNGIVVEKVGGGGGYTFNHTASVLLFDRTGTLAGTLSPSDTPENRKKKLERLIAG